MMNETKQSPNRFSAFFAPPKFENEDKTRLAALLNFITVLYLIIIGLLILTVIVYPGEDPAASYVSAASRAIPYFIVLLVVKILMSRGMVTAAARFFIVIYSINVLVQVVLNGGMSGPNSVSMLVTVVMAGLLMGFRASATLAAIFFAAGIGISMLETRNALPTPLTLNGPVNILATLALNMVAVVGLLRLYLRQLADAANNLRAANRELQLSGIKLEQQVKDRTRALATSIEIGRRLSTIMDAKRLVNEVVNELQGAFGYYHVHIYLYSADGQSLVMAGGTGEPGRAMLARQHQIEPGRGLVGRAAQTNQPVAIMDVSMEAGWLANPLLPGTRSEVAVPITIGNEVMGVLDVQQDIPYGFTPQDVDLLHSIGSQVAIALQNARTYEATQRKLERDAFVAGLSQKIQSAETIEEVLQVAVSQLGQTLGAQRASVELRSPEAINDSKTSSK